MFLQQSLQPDDVLAYSHVWNQVDNFGSPFYTPSVITVSGGGTYSCGSPCLQIGPPVNILVGFEAVGGVVELAAPAAARSASSDASGRGAAVIAAIGVGTAATTIGLGFAAWYARRPRAA